MKAGDALVVVATLIGFVLIALFADRRALPPPEFEAACTAAGGSPSRSGQVWVCILPLKKPTLET